MAEVEVIKIDTGESAKSVADLRKEIKAYNDELSKTKVGTAEYQATLEKLGAAKDDLGDLKDTINALNPEGKVAAFSNVAGKLAGGFQAATGAAALFGGKAEEVEQALLKVQAATAFAQGIQSVTALGDAFVVLKAAIMSVNPIFLGIAAAVTAIAIAYKVWSDNMSEAAKNDALLNAQLEKQQRLQEDINNELDRNLEIRKAAGLAGAELLKQELADEIQRYAAIRARQMLLTQIKDKTDEQREELKKVSKEEADTYANLLVLKLNINKQEREDNQKLQDDRVAKYKEANARIKAEQEKALAERRKLEDEDAEQYFKNQEVIEKQNNDAAEKAAAEQKKKEDEIKEAERLAEETEYQYESEQRSKRIQEDLAAKQEASDQAIILAQQESTARKAILDTSLQAAKGLSDLYFQYQLNNVTKGSKAEAEIRKKQFNINKAFGITNAVIDGIGAVQKALNNPYPLNLILAAASGILATRSSWSF